MEAFKNQAKIPGKALACCLAVLVLLFAASGQAAATNAGPTLRLDYDRSQAPDNPISQFMYFVPLISPEPVCALANAGNTQCARVISSSCRVAGAAFLATCEFEFTGEGSQRNVLDHTGLIHRHEKELRAGGSLKRELGSINVEGAGSGSIEIEGTTTNGVRSVNEVRLRFNNHGKSSPVSITLQDITWRDGAARVENKLIARVNSLVFRRAAGTPKMEVTLASLKKADAGDHAWQNFMGGLKGKLVNLLLPPVPIEAAGRNAMLDFGRALADKDPTFTFPAARNLKTAP